MADLAAEARERAERHQGLLAECEPEGMVSRPHICVFSDALSVSARDVVALSARLAQECALRAQAEQERDELLRDPRGSLAKDKAKIRRLEARLRVTDALLREYEEALRKIASGLELPGGRHDLYAAHASQEIARAALAKESDG